MSEREADAVLDLVEQMGLDVDRGYLWERDKVNAHTTCAERVGWTLDKVKLHLEILGAEIAYETALRSK